MKKILTILILALAICACEKSPTGRFRGYYSFKTGGTITISGKAHEIRTVLVRTDTIVHVYTVFGKTIKDTTFCYKFSSDTISSRDTSFLRHLVPESGQMNVLENGGNSMKVTMNILAGDPVVFDATADGDSITLVPAERLITVSSEEWDEDCRCYLTVGGKGKRYDNLILFDLDLSGPYCFEGFDGTVTQSKINCIASANE